MLESDRFGGGSLVVLDGKKGGPEDVLCCNARQFQCIISTTAIGIFTERNGTEWNIRNKSH